ncbi:MAG: hypothetical protein V1663_00675 [archaeon]
MINMRKLLMLFILILFLNSCSYNKQEVAARINEDITIFYPIDKQFVSDKIIVRGLSKDMQYVEIQIDTNGWKKVNGVDEWYYNLNTNNFDNGGHVIYLRGFDGTNYSEIMAVRINVKN